MRLIDEEEKKMNADKKTITCAKAKVMMSASLRKACNAMFVDKRHSPYPEARNLSEWLEKELDFLALMIGDARNVTVNNLICALRVEMLGDKLSSAMAQNSRRNGWDSDSVSYVEDGKVFSKVFVSGKPAEENKNEACAVQSVFAMSGYDAHMELFDADANEYCVYASMGFAEYAKKNASKRS